MSLLIVSFLTSLCATLLVVRSARLHARVSADVDLTGPQKFHSTPVPRIGGLGIVLAIVAGTAFAGFTSRGAAIQSEAWLVVACSLPAFLSGLTEDVTKRVSARRRLVFTCISAALGCWLLGAVLPKTDIPGVDALMPWVPFAVALTLLCVTGVANAVNIIDGFNGLASMCVLLMLLALAYCALQVGDSLVLTLALVCAGATLGFFMWNFPAGLIFLGDGGAYLLGFMVAELSVLLIARNPGVSPLFPLLACAYPIFETIFTIYRRKFIRGVPTGAPDGIHLHTLIHRRIVRHAVSGLGAGGRERRQTVRNSMTSPYLWLLCMLSVIPAVLWWNNSAVLAVFIVLFMLSYVFLYWSIVRFRVPKWMIFGGDAAGAVRSTRAS
jgi:UDP-N-acetylmuramyl pentapeptide phosphotransferase/UDP-N-acetylglucosamine-1-phosphate transferase